ncbi:hypothetical protein LSUB1_G000184 [Lachnellula subtilissima]|uniref:DUF6594 domain-containing protein n=1 Tax=Lachnellula subtilissima TaxID=602034 RepID=A0A8H8S1L3_9HELO|nr:hypothetical protein LSUB1_G000184 [Lachnellula subtilissima]
MDNLMERGQIYDGQNETELSEVRSSNSENLATTTTTTLQTSNEKLAPSSVKQCYEGYPRLAALLDSDENFMIYRRFGYLQARIILYKQDELRQLEKDLDLMDMGDAKTRPIVLQSREEDNFQNERRKDLLCRVEKKFKEYTELLITARDLATFNPPPACDYMSVKNYFDKAAPLSSVECYIYRKEDLVTLKPGREYSWLDSFVEKVLQQMFCRPIRELRAKADPKEVRLFSRARIDILVSLIILLVIVALLIGPVYILWQLTTSSQSVKSINLIIVVLLLFTLLFSGVLSLFTRAKRHEILAAAAAYCAVLVVFIGNVGKLNT